MTLTSGLFKIASITGIHSTQGKQVGEYMYVSVGYGDGYHFPGLRGGWCLIRTRLVRCRLGDSYRALRGFEGWEVCGGAGSEDGLHVVGEGVVLDEGVVHCCGFCADVICIEVG